MITDFMLKLLQETEKATGADFSKHKGLWTITEDLLPLLRTVMDFVILRAGYGALDRRVYTDPKFEENYAKVIKWLPGALRGAYWYFSSNMSWTVQYERFAELIRDKDFHFLVLDFEQGYNTKLRGFAIGALYFMEKLEQEFPNKKIFIYANRYTYDDWISPFTKEIDRFPLWIAQYPWRNWWDIFTQWFKTFWTEVILGGTRGPTLPISRKGNPEDWELWQIGDKTKIGNELGFFSDDLDFNISRRSKEDFFEFITGRPYGEPEPTDPTDEPTLPTPHPDLGNLRDLMGELEAGVALVNYQFQKLDDEFDSVFPEE